MAGDGKDVVEETRDLGKHGANELGSGWDVDPYQFLYCQRVGLLIAHHGDVVQPVHIRQALHVGLVFHQLFRPPV